MNLSTPIRQWLNANFSRDNLAGNLFLSLSGCNLTGSNNPPGLVCAPSTACIDVNVTGVDIHFLETYPVQVELIIHGSLPERGRYDIHALDKRIDHQIRITLTARHPYAAGHARRRQAVEYKLLLGSWLPENQRGFAPGEYQLSINHYQATFSIAA
jgi:hypothetical protein